MGIWEGTSFHSIPICNWLLTQMVCVGILWNWWIWVTELSLVHCASCSGENFWPSIDVAPPSMLCCTLKVKRDFAYVTKGSHTSGWLAWIIPAGPLQSQDQLKSRAAPSWWWKGKFGDSEQGKACVCVLMLEGAGLQEVKRSNRLLPPTWICNGIAPPPWHPGWYLSFPPLTFGLLRRLHRS